jgi:hypothetical protein
MVSARPPNRALQVTPLARPVTWRFLHRRLVPSLASIYKPTSGAPEGYRWAA